MNGEGAAVGFFQLIDTSEHKQRFFEVYKDIDGLGEGPSEEFVFCVVALVCEFDSRDAFGVV